MANRNRLVQLAVHYLVVVLLIFLVLAGVRELTGGTEFVTEMIIALTVATLYILLIRYLGIVPDSS